MFLSGYKPYYYKPSPLQTKIASLLSIKFLYIEE